MDLKRLERVILKDCGLTRKAAIVVGVSGGPDSLCLASVLKTLGFVVIAAHLNHQIRQQADEDAKFVEDFAAKNRFEFVLGSEDIPTFADKAHLSIEEAARKKRYQFLFAIAEKVNAGSVAVGHNADDQVETILMHLIRGAGTTGLRGMLFRSSQIEWSETIPLVRPLLGCWRREIEDYCLENALHPIKDLTNLDVSIYRNRLRHELIPYLEKYNPKIKDHIWKTAEILGHDQVFIDDYIDQMWKMCVIRSDKTMIQISRQKFKGQMLPIKRGLLRRALFYLLPDSRDIGYAVVSKAVDFIEHPTRSKKNNLINGISIQLIGNLINLSSQIFIDEEWIQANLNTAIEIKPGDTLRLGVDWTLEASLCKAADFPAEKDLKDPFQAWFNADFIKLPLKVRNRKRGDRFSPYGMNGKNQKLSDYFINRQLPAQARNHWPLVCSGDEIVWIPGYQSADAVGLKRETQQIYHMKIQKTSNH